MAKHNSVEEKDATQKACVTLCVMVKHIRHPGFQKIGHREENF